MATFVALSSAWKARVKRLIVGVSAELKPLIERIVGPENVFEDTFNQDYYGFMAGVDFGKEGPRRVAMAGSPFDLIPETQVSRVQYGTATALSMGKRSH